MVSFILPGNSASGGYEVANSLRFNDGSSDYLSFTPSSSPTSARIATISFWFKLSAIGTNFNLFSANQSGLTHPASFKILLRDGNGRLELQQDDGSAGNDFSLRTNQLFRDSSAWYHLVAAYDTTQGTSSNRIKLYINGSQVTSFSQENYPTQNLDLWLGDTDAHNVGRDVAYSSSYYDGYMAEFVYIDGQQLTPSSFGETDSTTGIWKPKKIGSFTSAGDNSFYLDFKDSSNLGNDASGLNNDFTVNNLTSIDQSTDTCVENFATLNPNYPYNYNLTLSDGNLTPTGTQNQWQGATSTMAINTGKWFYEAKFTSATDIINWSVGFGGMEDSVYTNATRNFVGFYNYDGGEIWVADSGHTPTTNDYGTFSNGDIIGIALDYDNEYISVYKNGSAIVTNFDYGAVGTSSYVKGGKFIAPKVFNYGSGTISLNFGNPPYAISSGNSDANGYGNFEYAVPANYYSLCSKNLAEYG